MLTLQLAAHCLPYIFVLSVIIFLDRNIDTALKVLFDFSISTVKLLCMRLLVPGRETLTQK